MTRSRQAALEEILAGPLRNANLTRVLLSAPEADDLWRLTLEDRTGRPHTVLVWHFETEPGPAALQQAERVAAQRAEPLVLLAPRLAEAAIARLDAAGIGHVDAAGNCRLQLDQGRILVHVEGRRARPAADRATLALAAAEPRLEARLSSPRGSLRAAGHRVLFALLADDQLLTSTVRAIGEVAGASRHAVAQLLRRLRDEGLLVRLGRTGHAWVPGRRAELVDRFAKGWSDLLRHAQTIGRFRSPASDTETIAARLEAGLDAAGTAFGWGGTAGAMRLTPHYRGDDIVLHLADWNPDLQRQLRLAPAHDGPVTLLHCMGGLDLRTTPPHTAHPLLIFAELLNSADPRARETADLIATRHLLGDEPTGEAR